MRDVAYLRTTIVLGCSALLACGGGGARRAARPAGPLPEVVKPLQAPDTPDRIIYTAPVSLAKPADTTAHARKPKS